MLRFVNRRVGSRYERHWRRDLFPRYRSASTLTCSTGYVHGCTDLHLGLVAPTGEGANERHVCWNPTRIESCRWPHWYANVEVRVGPGGVHCKRTLAFRCQPLVPGGRLVHTVRRTRRLSQFCLWSGLPTNVVSGDEPRDDVGGLCPAREGWVMQRMHKECSRAAAARRATRESST